VISALLFKSGAAGDKTFYQKLSMPTGRNGGTGMRFRTEIIASTALALIAALVSVHASAADMQLKAARIVAAPSWSWTGLYVGGHVGWAGARQTGSTSAFPSPGFGAPAIVGGGIAGIGLLPVSHNLDDKGLIAGGHAGYNWQFNQLVFGVEGDFTWLDRSSSNSQNLITSFGFALNAGPVNLIADTEWLATVRGRLGYAWNALLIYGTGGVAFTDTNYRANYAGAPTFAPPLPAASGSFGGAEVGFAVGGGAEWMLTQNWLLRAEYLYYNFDGGSVSMPIPAGGTCTPGLCSLRSNSGDLEFHTVRAGLSYKW
jgi:outer membrane immunogenic protein